MGGELRAGAELDSRGETAPLGNVDSEPSIRGAGHRRATVGRADSPPALPLPS